MFTNEALQKVRNSELFCSLAETSGRVKLKVRNRGKFATVNWKETQ